MIVGDAYQRRGIGTRLLRRLLKPSERLACREIVATVVAGNAPMLHIFDASGPDWVRPPGTGGAHTAGAVARAGPAVSPADHRGQLP